METGRAEFTAILTALHSIVDVLSLDKKSELKALELKRPTVLIVSDREDLVGSINRLFKREKNCDLWSQFEWYEKYFDIEATHIKRNTNTTHNIVDAVASGLRNNLVEYVQIQKEINHI